MTDNTNGHPINSYGDSPSTEQVQALTQIAKIAEARSSGSPHSSGAITEAEPIIIEKCGYAPTPNHLEMLADAAERVKQRRSGAVHQPAIMPVEKAIDIVTTGDSVSDDDRTAVQRILDAAFSRRNGQGGGRGGLA